jgi:hypothetical protein
MANRLLAAATMISNKRIAVTSGQNGHHHRYVAIRRADAVRDAFGRRKTLRNQWAERKELVDAARPRAAAPTKCGPDSKPINSTTRDNRDYRV